MRGCVRSLCVLALFFLNKADFVQKNVKGFRSEYSLVERDNKNRYKKLLRRMSARFFNAAAFYLTCRLAALSKAATAVNDNTSMTMPKMVLLMAKFTTASKKTSAIQGGSTLKPTLRPLCRELD